MNRHAWTSLTDPQLLAQCEVDTYRASGPGGQKRNKTSSAVRLRHPGSGLLVIAEESRSQYENKAKALKRLRQALVLKLREPIELAAVAQASEITAAKNSDGRLDLRRKDPRFWPAVGVALDVLEATAARVAEAAELLDVTTGNFLAFLQTDPKVWEQANVLRTRHGHKPLKTD